jgi:hypothetical protein
LGSVQQRFAVERAGAVLEAERPQPRARRQDRGDACGGAAPRAAVAERGVVHTRRGAMACDRS